MINSKVNPDWINEERVKLFKLLDYVSKIKLQDTVLEHLEYTNDDFSNYLKSLAHNTGKDESKIISYWLDSGLNELQNSASIEKHSFKNVELLKGDLFFDTLAINHERIKKIHRFVCEHSDTNNIKVGEYRTDTASVGCTTDDGNYQTYWYGVEPQDIKNFMDGFFEFYKSRDLRAIYSSPFLRASLAHLLFVRIHPFGDGNGRTARIIQNISFTSEINRLYGTNLRICPLNVSENIRNNRMRYSECINKIYFDLEHDNNEWINKYLDFMLNMYDEQLYYQTNRLSQLDEYEYQDDSIYDNFEQRVNKSRVRKLFR